MGIKKTILTLLVLISATLPSQAQYYEIANQLTNLISPALSGSMKYRGFVDAKGVAGIGQNRANFVGISTSQGFQYASWFFMGAGMGIDMVKCSQSAPNLDYGNTPDPSLSQTRAMIPVFSDFRFNISTGAAASMFIDLKLGAAWLLGNKYMRLNDAMLTTATQFYMVPSIGVRVPVSSQNAKQAVNIGLTYQLLTSNNRYYNYDSPTLSALGLTIGFEW